MKRYSSQSGFVLLLAVLIASVVLTVGLAVANISLKGILISSSGRESQIAFAAADAGYECAYYWDKIDVAEGSVEGHFTVFAISSDPSFNVPLPGSERVYCYGRNLVNDWTIAYSDPLPGDASGGAITAFTFVLDSDQLDLKKPCAYVEVEKSFNPLDPAAPKTVIRSRGFNSCDTTNLRRVQRAIIASY